MISEQEFKSLHDRVKGFVRRDGRERHDVEQVVGLYRNNKAARFLNSHHLTQGSKGINQVHENSLAGHHVAVVGGQRQVAGVASFEGEPVSIDLWEPGKESGWS